MDVKLEILSKNMEVSERLNEYTGKKLEKLNKVLPMLEEIRVDYSYVKSARSAMDRNVAQITLRGKGFILRTEERSEDIFTAFDAALDKMQRQIERFKGKHFSSRGDGRSASDVAPERRDVTAPLEMPIIVRRKHFHLIPMDEYEAIEQMNLLGHESFFVFYNANSSTINVLYARRDGTYGLIIPEIA